MADNLIYFWYFSVSSKLSTVSMHYFYNKEVGKKESNLVIKRQEQCILFFFLSDNANGKRHNTDFIIIVIYNYFLCLKG